MNFVKVKTHHHRNSSRRRPHTRPISLQTLEQHFYNEIPADLRRYRWDERMGIDFVHYNSIVDTALLIYHYQNMEYLRNMSIFCTHPSLN